MTDRFAGQTVIVTGAGSGIGRATAVRIAREGGRVVAVDLAADRIEALSNEHQGLVLVPVVADITDEGTVAHVIAAAGDTIDGLANVAGVADDNTPAHEVTDAVWRRTFSVNVDGVLRLTRAVLPAMLRTGRGSIVNVASEAALRGNAAGVAYTAAKHAVVGITRNSAFMYGGNSIRVNAVAPGAVATGMPFAGRPEDFGVQRITPFKPLIPSVATPEQLAAAITFLLSDDSANISGAILPSDGGWSAQ